MAHITNTLRSADGGATIHVLSDGRAVREGGVTGLMLLSEVGGDFVRYLDSLDEVVEQSPNAFDEFVDEILFMQTCAGCGHLHFDAVTTTYRPCPVRDCDCRAGGS